MEIVAYDEQQGKDDGISFKMPISFGPTRLLSTAFPQTSANKTDLFELEFVNFGDQDCFRAFIAQTVETYITAQKEFKKAYPEPIPPKIVTSLSLTYRGAILELVKSLQDAQTEESSRQAMLFSQLDCVWHFCEIIFISSNPELPILPYYMDWISVNFDDSDAILSPLIEELPDLEPDSLFTLWKLIYKHTFHGRTQEAAKLLEYTNLDHSSVFSEQLTLMGELLRKKPVFRPTMSSVSGFNSEWVAWREECENRLNNLAFCGSEQLTFLAKILCGRDDGFLEARLYISTWYEYLCMMLNYQFPLLRPSSMKAYANKAIEDYGEFTIVLSKFDEILMSALEYDIITILKEMQKQWGHPWFPLHFSQLIFSGGVYSDVADSRIDYKAIGPIYYDLVREYGIELMLSHSLWEVGVKYLECIPAPLGLPVISELLQHIKPSTELEVEKILRIGKKFNMTREMHGICRGIAIRRLKEGHAQNALLWAIRGGDGGLTSLIVDQILIDGDTEIVPSLIELLPNFSACGERLLFLNGFVQFKKCVQRRKWKDAVEILCKLIAKDLIPSRLRVKLIEFVYEIGKNGTKLEGSQISTLMEFLHMKVGKAVLGLEKFKELSEILINARSSQMITQFKMSKKCIRT